MGLTNYTRDLILTNISNNELLVLGLRVAKKLEWDIKHISANGFIAINSSKMFNKHSEITLRLVDEMPDIESHSIATTMYDFGRNKKYIESFIEELNSELTNIDRAQLEQEYEEIKKSFVESSVDSLQEGTLSYEISNMDFFDYFKPTKNYLVTPIIIYLNLALMILMLAVGVDPVNPSAEMLLFWGGNSRNYTMDGELWRLLTACFVHIGVIHLLLNLNALVFVGFVVEKQIGSLRFLLAYLLTGIFASVCSIYWNDNIVSAGASGAIFGIYGLYLVLLVFNVLEKSIRKAFLSSILFFVGYNLLYGFAKEGIDNAAHIGGLISGIIIALLFLPGFKENTKVFLKKFSVAIASLAILLLSYVVYAQIPTYELAFSKIIQQFSEQENTALRIFSLPPETPDDTLLHIIKDESIPLWKSNIGLLKNTLNTELSPENLELTKKLIKYSELRLETYELIYKSVGQKTDLYNMDIEIKSREIEKLINEL